LAYRWGRAFLCGDAAHVHSPAGGQGMNTGMQDAFNLAWKLALVATGRCVDSLLDSYSPERSYVGEQVLKNAQRLTLVGTTRNPVARALRDAVGHLILGLAPVQHAFADTMTEVSVGYPNSPLNAGSAAGLRGPKPGERIVTEQPFGAGPVPRFALLAKNEEGSRDLLRRYAEIMEERVRQPPEEGGVWLVRPDGYVATAARADNWRLVEASLIKAGSPVAH